MAIFVGGKRCRCVRSFCCWCAVSCTRVTAGIMDFRSSGTWRWITRTAAYTTTNSPNPKPYMPKTDDTRLLPRGGMGKFASLKFKGSYMPLYISLGLIILQMSIGLYTVKHHLAYSPAVRIKKKERQTLPEVTNPEKVVDEADKFVTRSFFRKVVHVQEFNSGMQYLKPSPYKDAYAHPRRADTLVSGEIVANEP